MLYLSIMNVHPQSVSFFSYYAAEIHSSHLVLLSDLLMEVLNVPQ